MWARLRLEKIVYALQSPLGRRALRHGLCATAEHRRAFHGRTFQSVFDVGANRGQFALLAHIEFPAARIVSFEPSRHPAKIFRAVFRGEPLVSLQPLALGSRARITTINVTADDDASSLLPIGQVQSRVFGTRPVMCEDIEVARFDQIVAAADIKPPALLKIDTQGYELEVLRGCGDLLALFDCVYVELSHTELYEGQPLADEILFYMRQQGFHLQGFFNQSADERGAPIQADYLFARDRRPSPAPAPRTCAETLSAS